MKDFYGDWSIEKTCDTVTLELNYSDGQLFYTHVCKDDEIAYFKVDRNMISAFPNMYLGKVRKIQYLIVVQTFPTNGTALSFWIKHIVQSCTLTLTYFHELSSWQIKCFKCSLN